MQKASIYLVIRTLVELQHRAYVGLSLVLANVFISVKSAVIVLKIYIYIHIYVYVYIYISYFIFNRISLQGNKYGGIK